MAYLGNQPSNNFVSLKRQVITGNGGSTYTLDHKVASVNDCAIFVSNVRQDPASYSISNGNQLTLGGTISSSDSCYVIFLGQALQTVTPATNTITNAMIASDAGIATTKLGTGAVLQIVTSQNDTTSRETTSTSYVTAGTTATITPSSTSSKIFVLISWNEDVNNTNTIHFVTVFRGSTNIGFGSDVAFARFHDVSAGRALIHTSAHKIDEPSTTSSTTYTLYHKVGAGTGRVRNDLVPATMTLMEIAG